MKSLFRQICSLLLLASALVPLVLPDRAKGQELRSIEGRYIRIITDIPTSDASEQWTIAFDTAIPKFCDFWQVPVEAMNGWKVTCCVMTGKDPFRRAGLLPVTVPDFPNGFQIGNDTWVLEQPSEYYTRHLIIHEGAHAFAFQVFGGAGPAWFMEGTAEFLATHRWDGSTIELGIVPESADAFPYWGRFRILSARRDRQQALSLASVLRYSEHAHQQVEPYAWTWAAIQLLANYPDTRQLLIDAARNGRKNDSEFTKDFLKALGPTWSLAQTRWRVLIDEFDYRYDFSRNTLSINGDAKGDAIGLKRTQVEIAANKGWQNTGLRLSAGAQVEINASGLVVLARDPQPWNATPDGVTVRYYDGLPLGQLVATVLDSDETIERYARPISVRGVGSSAVIRAEEAGWLFLKVGDHPAELDDNEGNFVAEIRALE